MGALRRSTGKKIDKLCFAFFFLLLTAVPVINVGTLNLIGNITMSAEHA